MEISDFQDNPKLTDSLRMSSKAKELTALAQKLMKRANVFEAQDMSTFAEFRAATLEPFKKRLKSLQDTSDSLRKEYMKLSDILLNQQRSYPLNTPYQDYSKVSIEKVSHLSGFSDSQKITQRILLISLEQQKVDEQIAQIQQYCDDFCLIFGHDFDDETDLCKCCGCSRSSSSPHSSSID